VFSIATLSSKIVSFEEKNNDPTSINTYPINQDLKIETPEISHTEKLGEKWCGGAGIPANKGFCGAGGGAGGAGTSVPIPPEPIYEEGDRIICYPTMQHESNGWKVKATIDSIEYEQGYMLTCTVSYKNQKKEDKTAVIGGANCDWLLGKV
jgi:hypothetical protein